MRSNTTLLWITFLQGKKKIEISRQNISVKVYWSLWVHVGGEKQTSPPILLITNKKTCSSQRHESKRGTFDVNCRTIKVKYGGKGETHKAENSSILRFHYNVLFSQTPFISRNSVLGLIFQNSHFSWESNIHLTSIFIPTL